MVDLNLKNFIEQRYNLSFLAVAKINVSVLMFQTLCLMDLPISTSFRVLNSFNTDLQMQLYVMKIFVTISWNQIFQFNNRNCRFMHYIKDKTTIRNVKDKGKKKLKQNCAYAKIFFSF